MQSWNASAGVVPNTAVRAADPLPQRRSLGPRRISAEDQHLQFMRQQGSGHPVGGGRPEAKLPPRQTLVAQPKSLPIVNQQLDRLLPAVAEDDDSPREGILFQHRATTARQAVNPTPKVRRLHCHQHAHLRGNLNHDRPRKAFTNPATFTLAPFRRIVSLVPSAATTSTTASSRALAWLSAVNPLSSINSAPSGNLFPPAPPRGRPRWLEMTRCLSAS